MDSRHQASEIGLYGYWCKDVKAAYFLLVQNAVAFPKSSIDKFHGIQVYTGGRKVNLKIILIVIVACLAVVFTIQNVAAVTVSIFFWEISFSFVTFPFLLVSFPRFWVVDAKQRKKSQ